MFTDDGNIKITDFGGSKQIGKYDLSTPYIVSW